MISEKRAQIILQPYYEIFVSAHKKAIDDWKNLVSQFPATGPRVRAGFINDRVREYIREEFRGEMIVERYGRFLLILNNEIIIRFKKLRNKLPSNIPTLFSRKLESQQLELGSALSPATLVNVGYAPNKMHTEFQYLITCNLDKENIWGIDITPSENIIPNIVETDIETIETNKKRVQKKAN